MSSPDRHINKVKTLLLPVTKHPIILNDIHPFNRKLMTIIFFGTLNIPGTNTYRHNALRIQRISEANLRCAGQVCLNAAINGLRGI